MSDRNVVRNPWQALRQFTDARIALGRAGISMPTEAQLEFQLAHARARDAVHHALDTAALAQEINGMAEAPAGECLLLHSAADSRRVYLQRPDLGRRLDRQSRKVLEAMTRTTGTTPLGRDLVLVIADGLSAPAIAQNVSPFLRELLPAIAREGWSLAPVMLVRQGRVAIGDEIGELLNAGIVVMMIGERPGLSSPDSMGLYITWGPRVGQTDERRNCISNVRPAGLGYKEAAAKLHYLLREAFRRRLTGIGLKDEAAGLEHEDTATAVRFLL
jgi:ethanolamine ammonia-lyase small subunit